MKVRVQLQPLRDSRFRLRTPDLLTLAFVSFRARLNNSDSSSRSPEPNRRGRIPILSLPLARETFANRLGAFCLLALLGRG
jgi:hypothetical protein